MIRIITGVLLFILAYSLVIPVKAEELATVPVEMMVWGHI